MNWITAPSRAFGVGETKSQNAVIKVYSAAELKAALTKVYQLPSGIGTIEIAGDIVITEPIKLRQFRATDKLKPSEIIIKAISGARIINGNTTAGTYNYDGLGINTEIPVFDFGEVGNNTAVIPDPVANCKYTFMDINVNATTARNFGAFVAWGGTNNTYFAYAAPILLNNINLNNVNAVFGLYNKENITVRASLIIQSAVVNDLKINNVSGQNIYLFTRVGIGLYYCSFTGIDNYITFGVTNRLLIDLSSGYIPKYSYNTFISCGMPIEVTGADYKTSTYINCTLINGLSGGVTVGSDTNAFPSLTRKEGTVVYTRNLFDADITYESTYAVNNFGNQPIDVNIATLDNTLYQINWKLNVRYTGTGLTNEYNMITHVRVSAGTATIVSNTTLSASEEVTTLIGLIPVVAVVLGQNVIRITPVDSGALSIRTHTIVAVSGNKF